MAQRVFRTTRLNISASNVRRLAARQVGRVNQPAPEAPQRLLIGIYINYTWDFETPEDFSPSKMTSSSYLRGYNWQTWKNAITARVLSRGGTPAAEIIEDNPTNSVYFKGEAIFDLAAMADIAWIRVGVPPSHVNAIKTRSTIGTRVVLGFHNIESINQCHGFTQQEDIEISTLRPGVLAAKTTTGCTKPSQSPTVNGYNAYGCTAIDKYEHAYPQDVSSGLNTCSAVFLANSVACPHTPAHAGLPAYSHKPGESAVSGKHTWDVDIRNISPLLDLMNAIYEIVDPGGFGSHDGDVFDNILEDPFGGFTKKNDYPDSYTSSAYRTAYKAILAQFHLNFTQNQEIGDFWIWGNAPENVNIYTAEDIRNRFYEFAFRNVSSPSTAKTFAEIQAMLQVVKDNNLRVQLGMLKDQPNPANSWATGTGPGGANGTWSELAAHIRALGITDRVFIQAARSTSGGYIYWQPEFRDLV